MAAPTFVSETDVAFARTSGTSRVSGSISVQSGDRLVVMAGTEDESYSLNSVSDSGGNTWTSQQSGTVTDYGAVRIWTATAAATGSITVTVTISNPGGGDPYWGFNVSVWRGSHGIGASSKANAASGAPSLSLTTTQADSAIAWINTDWNAADGASRTYRTVNGSTGTEHFYSRDSARLTAYGHRYSDVGAIGSKTVGLTAPSGQKYQIAAVEIKGTASGATVERSAALTAATAITAAGTGFSVLERSAALTAATAATVAATERDLHRTAAITAATSITADGHALAERSASLTAATGVTATGHAIVERTASPTAQTGIDATGTVAGITERSASLTAATAVTVAVTERDLDRTASLTAATGVTATGHAVVERAASLTATTGIDATGTTDGVVQRSASLTATTAVTTGHQRDVLRTTTLTAASAVTITGHERHLLRTTTLTAATSITATGTRIDPTLADPLATTTTDHPAAAVHTQDHPAVTTSTTTHPAVHAHTTDH